MKSEKKGLFSKKATKQSKGSSFSISTPTDFRTAVHVDREFNWTGDPKEAFEFQKKLGEGAYGAVYKAILKSTKTELAIKTIRLTQQESENLQEEINILKECRHPNIVCYYGSAAISSHSVLWIMMDFCEGGSVASIIESRPGKRLAEDQIGAVLGGVLSGLNYLHNKKIIHRDIKPANMLVTGAGEVKIGDFGISSQLAGGKTAKAKTVIGTPLFMSPEVIEGKTYTQMADIWSLGITAIECAEGENRKAPRDELTPFRAMFVIVNEPAPSLEDIEKWSPDFYNFVANCLQKNPNRRPPASALLKDPWVEKTYAKAKDVISQLLVTRNQRKDASVIRSSSLLPPELREQREETEVEEESLEHSYREQEPGGGGSSSRHSAREERSQGGYLTLEKPEREGQTISETEISVSSPARPPRSPNITLEKRVTANMTLERPVERPADENSPPVKKPPRVKRNAGSKGGVSHVVTSPKGGSLASFPPTQSTPLSASGPVKMGSLLSSPSLSSSSSPRSPSSSSSSSPLDARELGQLLSELAEWRRKTQELEDKIKRMIEGDP